MVVRIRKSSSSRPIFYFILALNVTVATHLYLFSEDTCYSSRGAPRLCEPPRLEHSETSPKIIDSIYEGGLRFVAL